MIWVQPDVEGIELHESNFLARVGIDTKYGIKTINFALNGVPAGNARGFKLADKKKHKYDELAEQEFNLAPGNNLIKITVVDNLNNVEFLERTVVFLSETKSFNSAPSKVFPPVFR